MAFICKECADRVGWTYHGFVSFGECELCDQTRRCDDIKGSKPPANMTEMEAIRRERDERRANRTR